MKPLHEYTETELLAELRKRATQMPRWGIFIPEQWATGIKGSSKAIVEEAASRTLRGSFTYEARLLPEPITRPGQIGDEDG